MSRRKRDESVYLVGWPDGVIKAGQTAHNRWRDFEIRNAMLLGLWSFGRDWERTMDVEKLLLRLLYSLAPGAFTHGREAVPYLGGVGGWRECYRMPVHMLGHAAEQCALAVLKHDREQVQP